MLDPVRGFAPSGPHGFLYRGLRLLAIHRDYELGAIFAAAAAAASLALAAVIWRRRRWGLLVAGIGGLLALVAVWLATAYIVHVELASAGPRAVGLGPFGGAAVKAAVAASVLLAVLTAAATTAFATAFATAPDPPGSRAG